MTAFVSTSTLQLLHLVHDLLPVDFASGSLLCVKGRAVPMLECLTWVVADAFNLHPPTFVPETKSSTSTMVDVLVFEGIAKTYGHHSLAAV